MVILLFNACYYLFFLPYLNGISKYSDTFLARQSQFYKRPNNTSIQLHIFRLKLHHNKHTATYLRALKDGRTNQRLCGKFPLVLYVYLIHCPLVPQHVTGTVKFQCNRPSS